MFDASLKLQDSGDVKAMQKSVSYKRDFSHSYLQREMTEFDPSVP